MRLGLWLGAALMLLAECTSDTPSAVVRDICNIHASWVSSDRPEADEARLANALRDALPVDGDGAVAASARAFVDAVMGTARRSICSVAGFGWPARR